MIVLDTTILTYAVGGDHPLAAPCRRIIEAQRDGLVQATTTVEAIQEFVHVRARRRGRVDAAGLGRAYAALFAPLLTPTEADLDAGLRLFERHEAVGAFDAVLAASAIAQGARALVSADTGFANVPRLRFVDVSTEDLDELVAGDG